ncbi:type III secretion system chaperone [Photobacterium chitinilyticum]|mgnify:CR=1 FL=1|uniref:CesT family type III secretion system chaperone n=1 Tax=Photobacterium chitinilyticum TaxID=2485123 RepID=A0A444JTP2_9GAMM|nr:type III secretion system chaperone [Photobacterium chitinilyticum]RWX56419.1 CesT family type III secretion system chaperone [Photobacterium chitinilyticum]
MELKQLMADFCQDYGIDLIEPNEEGIVTLAINQDSVRLHLQEHKGYLVLFTQIGILPEDITVSQLKQILGANYFWLGTKGFTISLSSENDMLIASRQDAMEVVHYEGFAAMIEAAVEVVEHWRKVMADGFKSVESQAPQPDATTMMV